MGFIFVIVLLLFVLVLVGYLVGVYNQLIGVRVNVDRSWSNIEVLEKQRYDEIPRLVKVCEGYMQYERETLEKVIAARTRYLAAQGPAAKAEAGSLMAGALKSLFAVVENYPELKANQNFMQLQNRITELENEIADRREFYNDSVNTFNIRIQQMPDTFVASFMNVQPRSMFKVEEADKTDVPMTFGAAR